ncbi:MAG: hypothetical protein WDN44_00775 [Sphingomonas sp.]
MRKLLLTLGAATLAVPAVVPITAADAQTHRVHHYRGHTARHYTRCRHSPGNTGLVAGGVGGALVGRSILGHGLLGTVRGRRRRRARRPRDRPLGHRAPPRLPLRHGGPVLPAPTRSIAGFTKSAAGFRVRARREARG